MAPKKKSGLKVKKGEPVDALTEAIKNELKVQNQEHASFWRKMQTEEGYSEILSKLPKQMQTKQKELQEEAQIELNKKLLHLKSEAGRALRMDDGDQSKLKGDKGEVLMKQWSGGMDYAPAHPGNTHLSPWLRTLWRGDYQAAMHFMDGLEKHEIRHMLEVRESLLNVSAVFHVTIGARTLCGKNPVFRNTQLAAHRMMDIKNEHQKILAKLIELGANVNAKDVAGFTPLHHCLTTYSNPTTLSMAKQLLIAGADPNLQNRVGCTALFEPVMAANYEAVQLLLEFGGDPDIKENNGISCRFTAGTLMPKISELFCRADKKIVKKARASAKVDAGGSLTLCKVCGVDDDNKRCTGCYLVWYCGQKCQGEDWPTHKQNCKETKAQFKKVVLVEDNVSGKDHITKEIFCHKIGDIPTKKHFVVKVLKPETVPRNLKSTTGPDWLFVYNRDRSLCGRLYRDGAEEVYDLLLDSIKKEGFKGWKGFYYAIYTGGDKKKSSGNKPNVEIEINAVKMLPLEKW